MKSVKFFGALLIAVGLLIMVYGGFSYSKIVNTAKIGSAELDVKKKSNVYIPIWIGVVSVIAGGSILLIRRRDK
jgi:TRAP-type C4-dicarboxylate transport system permease small subunit